MADVIETIKTRRCVREYKDTPIPESDLELLIDCARYAPSGFNMQPWSFLVVTNKEIKHDISEQGKKFMIPILESIENKTEKVRNFLTFLKTDGTDMFYNAPALVVILGNENAMTTDYDCAMAAQNMMLAAHSLGIGSCWIGGIQPALMNSGLLKELGAPDGYKTVAPLIFGYPKGMTEMPEKNETEVVWIK